MYELENNTGSGDGTLLGFIQPFNFLIRSLAKSIVTHISVISVSTSGFEKSSASARLILNLLS